MPILSWGPHVQRTSRHMILDTLYHDKITRKITTHVSDFSLITNSRYMLFQHADYILTCNLIRTLKYLLKQWCPHIDVSATSYHHLYASRHFSKSFPASQVFPAFFIFWTAIFFNIFVYLTDCLCVV